MSQLRHNPASPLEIAVLFHMGAFFTFATWAFGGNAGWVRVVLSWWGLIGVLIMPVALLTNRRQLSVRRLGWLAPFGLFNVLVLASVLTPGLRIIQLGADRYYVQNPVPLWRPTAAIPHDAWHALWLFDVIYLSCFNLVWIVRRRRSLRWFLLFATGNAMLLAIFGTVQKLTGAKGLFFGLVRSPQIYFFSSFIYHNHWCAFVVLMVSACLGLSWHYGLKLEGQRNLFRTPAFGGLVAVFFLSTTAPLSASRSITLILFVFLCAAFMHWVAHLIRLRQKYKKPILARLAISMALMVFALGAIHSIAKKTIDERWAIARQQIADMRARGGLGSRTILYHDTWRMARDRLWFGWGMASYPKIFILYNTQSPGPVDHLPTYYHDAHNDWLQAAAEHGLIGTALLGLCALVPFAPLLRQPLRSALSFYIFVGCGLVALCGLFEFPFGNTADVLTWWMCFFIAVQYTRLENGAWG